MPTLDEYLGGIFASLTQARMMADAQAVSTAETYARHDLLRHFAVPHLRFSDIELTIPVAIEAVQPASQGAIPAADREALRNGILSGLTKPLGLRQFSRIVAKVLNMAIDAAIDRLIAKGRGRHLEESLTEFANDFASEVGKILDVIGVDPARYDSAAAAEVARGAASVHVKENLPPAGPGGLHVIAESHRLREQRPSDIITIKMSVSEEGMEWQHMELSDGRTERKLLPE